MKARPILFSGEMVRALLAGHKTQTRRIIKPRGGEEVDPEGIYDLRPGDIEIARCPYGQAGDLLWVREAIELIDYRPELEQSMYSADCTPTVADAWPWKRRSLPAMHCPRGLSRLTLGITDVRVERLNDISRGDAMEEGCPFPNMAKGPNPVDWYAELWREINGEASWDANPWVWVIEFVVHHANVDHILNAAREAGAA